MKKLRTHPDLSKTTWYVLVSLTFVLFACEKDRFYPDVIIPDPVQKSEITEVYTAYPEGSIISALNHTIFIRIPEGALDEPTDLTISVGQIVRNDSLVLMKKSVRIEMGESVMSKPYTLRMEYNPVELQCRDAADALCLNIYAFETNNANKVYSESCFQPIAACQVNSDLNTIQACFDKTGLFVVGKRK